MSLVLYHNYRRLFYYSGRITENGILKGNGFVLGGAFENSIECYKCGDLDIEGRLTTVVSTEFK